MGLADVCRISTLKFSGPLLCRKCTKFYAFKIQPQFGVENVPNATHFKFSAQFVQKMYQILRISNSAGTLCRKCTKFYAFQIQQVSNLGLVVWEHLKKIAQQTQYSKKKNYQYIYLCKALTGDSEYTYYFSLECRSTVICNRLATGLPTYDVKKIRFKISRVASRW